ncbi:hypothetical protein ACFVAD_19085 [Sutcliffiella sp. NPDC057660]|uniref:hypothetical protein n=1 Tax=Sutcliffiella sp. NPDC057660 TaxID=3346199 RepID=UPI0036AFC0DE
MWLFPITTPGPAAELATRDFSSHIYVFELELYAGNSKYYLGSPHFNDVDVSDHQRAIYRAKSITAIFTSIQRLSYSLIWGYDTSKIVFYYSDEDVHSFSLGVSDENIALEEMADPFKNQIVQQRTYVNQYHSYLNLAATDDLVSNVLILMNDAFNFAQYFYINLYKIVETIENDWGKQEIVQFSNVAKEALEYLKSDNIKGYMNNYMASGLFSRHGFRNRQQAAPSIINPPPVDEIKKELKRFINGWLNYKLNKTTITFSL